MILRLLLTYAVMFAPLQGLGGKSGVGGTAGFGGGAGSPVPTFVQKFDVFNNGAGATQNFVLTSNPTGGNGIFVQVTFSNTVTISSFVNVSSTAYTNQAWASGATNCDFNGVLSRFYYLKNLAGGANDKTLTINFSGSPSFVWFTAEEVSGVSTTAPVDKVDCGTAVNSTTPASPSLTPTNNGSYLLCMIADTNANNRTYTAGTSPAYTRRGLGTATTQNEEDFLQTTAAAVTGNWTTSLGVNSVTSLVVLH